MKVDVSIANADFLFVDKKKKYNIYNLEGEHGIGYTIKGERILLETRQFRICYKKIRMHRLLLNAMPKLQIDHVNRNKHDNRKSNLRIATFSQNNMNKTIGSNNTSGVRGVNWDEKRKMWRVRVWNNKKEINRYVKNLNEARRIRIELEYEYYKEYSPFL
jgi:hypothetical protein